MEYSELGQRRILGRRRHVFLNHCHACPGCFPLQPMEKHEKNPQLSVVSSTDINVVLSLLRCSVCH